MLLEDIFEKAKFSALQWAFSDKSFKGFPFSLVAFNWKDLIIGVYGLCFCLPLLVDGLSS